MLVVVGGEGVGGKYLLYTIIIIKRTPAPLSPLHDTPRHMRCDQGPHASHH